MCESLNEPRLLCIVLRGQFRYALNGEKLSGALHIIERVYSLAQEQNDAALMLGAYSGLDHAPQFGRLRVRSTIRERWCSDLALGKRPVLCRRLPFASRRLSVLWGDGRDLTSKEAE